MLRTITPQDIWEVRSYFKEKADEMCMSDETYYLVESTLWDLAEMLEEEVKA